MQNKLKIVFMGTPAFAVSTLDILVKNNYDVAAVVTVPDKPSGRGLKVNESDVKKYAVAHNIPVLQPEKLKDQAFQDALKEINANLFIVVAFRMLPESIWSMPKYGTFNLHASLLPQYRGAAPINWAVINGEKKSGITTFFIDKEIDTGKIIFRQPVPISANMTAGELHDTLMEKGAELVLDTVQAIENDDITPMLQEELIGDDSLRHAPKITKETCRINWNQSATTIHNFIRGLSPYPGAWTELINNTSGETHYLKILLSELNSSENKQTPGTINTDSKGFIHIHCLEGIISATHVQLAGKKAMDTGDLLRGFKLNNDWIVK